MELQPTRFAVLGIWLPAAPLQPWIRRVSIGLAAVLLGGVSFFAGVSAVHAHAEREAVQQR